LQGARVANVPCPAWNAGRVLEFDVLVEIPERLGLKRVSELALSEAVEGVAQLAEDSTILVLHRHC
jgi:hypothetical protein